MSLIVLVVKPEARNKSINIAPIGVKEIVFSDFKSAAGKVKSRKNKMSKKKIQVIPNPEKKNHEKWQPNQDLLDFPRPFRWTIMGKPSCGKTSLVLNYLVKSKPYANIFLLHPQTYNPNITLEDENQNKSILVDPPVGRQGVASNSISAAGVDIPEYKGVDFHALAYLPSMTFFDNIAEKHSLFIIDDIDLCSYLKKRNETRSERLNKLFSYVSTHKNLSIIVSSQDPSSQLPGFILKMCNIITVYQIRDEYIIQTMARKLSISYKRLKAFMELCKDKHDNITLDETDNSPQNLRYNIYTPITEKKKEKDAS